MNKITKEVLTRLEKTQKDFWNIPPEVGKFLYIQAKIKKPTNILELGTSNGYSTIWLAQAAKEVNADLTTVEYFETRAAMALNNFKSCQLDGYINIKQSKILDFLAIDKHIYDFVFIDANKAEYIDYFKSLEHKLSANALVISDNITSHRNELINFIDYTSSHPDFLTVFLPIGEGLLINLKK